MNVLARIITHCCMHGTLIVSLAWVREVAPDQVAHQLSETFQEYQVQLARGCQPIALSLGSSGITHTLLLPGQPDGAHFEP